ncbi:MAG TPA: CocE/NonD family hydrolase [Nocardioidaceae bacterium]|nr:CocE/NonD family hydrolase [Nocardioidaceae bacterium]
MHRVASRATAVVASLVSAALAFTALTSVASTAASADGTALRTLHVSSRAGAAASGWRPRSARYGVNVTSDVPITMSDGVKLYANVYRPARADGSPASGRFPVIVTQTPYNKSAPQLGFRNDYLVEHGYVQVVVDVRGTGSSHGSWDSFGSREQRDGYELVRWAHSKRRPWSNGRVGLWGISYAAINQFFTAAQRPPGLKATFPIVPAGDVYRDVVASGGQVDAGFIPLWLGLVTATGVVPPAYTAMAPDESLISLLQHVGGAAAFQLPMLAGATTGGDAAYDGPFYRKRSPLSVVDRVDVPTFVTGGEYDLFQRSEPLLYQRLRANGVPSRLLIGPWTHLQASSSPGLAADGATSLDALALRWFDRYVRGVPDRALGSDVKPVSYYEIGSGRWRTASRWLPSSVDAVAYRLDGDSTPGGAPGKLVRGAGRTPGTDDVYPVPVAGLCTRSASQWTAGIVSGTQCESDSRLNDLAGTSYQTAPFTRAMHLMGPINARLFVSTTARDGMLSVHVEDVAPDGTVDRLTGGWQVLSHRALDRRRSARLGRQIIQPFHPFTRAAQLPVKAGKVMGVDVEVFPTGAVLKPGHRLRITVQAYDTPHLLPTAPQMVDQVGGVITIHHSPRHPSRLVLPVRH